jgi:hypothetical protein
MWLVGVVANTILNLRKCDALLLLADIHEHREAAFDARYCRRCDVTSIEVDMDCGSVDDRLCSNSCLIVMLLNDDDSTGEICQLI